jgi:hypothetical protein
MIKAALHIVLQAGIAVCQQASENRVKIVTVREVLGDVNRYAGKAIAIVGRMRYDISLIDHYEFLSQDGCKRQIVTHGYTWPNEIQVWTFHKEGAPRPPSDKPQLALNEIAAKIAEVRRTTKLGTHTRPGRDGRGHYITVVEPNDWAVVYGRVVRPPQLDEDCGPRGCGGTNAPLLVLAEPDQVRIIMADGTLAPKEN